MPMFDVEYIFLQVRAKSVGEKSKLKLLCPDDGKTYAEIEVDLTKVQVQVEEDHTNKIELGDGKGMIMTYPTIESFKERGIMTITASNMLDVITSCILQVYEDEGKKSYEAKDQTKKELIEFVEQLNTKQFQQVQKFFDTMPKLKKEVTGECNCGKKNTRVLEGIADFFASG